MGAKLQVEEPTTEKMLEVIAEYFAKAQRLFGGKEAFAPRGVDEIRCPKCGSTSPGVVYQHGWRCLWLHCEFTFPKELTPPSPPELAKLFELEKRLRTITVWNKLLSRHGISI